MAILRRTEKAMMREMCGVRWYGHVLRRDNGDVWRKALEFEVAGRSGCGRPNMMWKSIPIRLS